MINMIMIVIYFSVSQRISAKASLGKPLSKSLSKSQISNALALHRRSVFFRIGKGGFKVSQS